MKQAFAKSQTRSWGYVFSFGILVCVFCVFLVVASVYIIVREEIGKVTEIQVTGQEIISQQEIISEITDILHEDCLIYASCEYVYWLPKEKIQHKLQLAFPRIEAVSVTTNYRDTLSVDVYERHLQYRYCNDELATDCYLVDSQGIAYDKAPKVSDLRGVSTVVFRHPLAITVPDTLPVQVFSDSLLHELTMIQDVIDPIGRVYTLSISKRDINVELDRLYDYSIANDTAIIKFNRKALHDPNSTEYVRAGLNRIESFKPFTDSFLEDPNSLEYLDVRFPKRIYMKFSDGEIIEEGNEESGL